MPKKLTYKQVKDYIESYGYKLLSEEYKNATTKLKVQCPNNHIYEVIFNSFKNRTRCPICKGGVRLSFNTIKDEIEKRGYKLLSTSYKNSQTYLKIECSKGHKFNIYYNSFQQGRKCPICNKIKNSELQRYSYDFIYSQIEKEGYQLLSENFEGVFSKLKLKCPEGHIYLGNYHNFIHGKRCPTCNYNNLSSNPEKEIQKYIKDIYNDKIVNNDRSVIINPVTGRNLELDVYLPDLNKAIEFNGDYWHSTPYQKVKDKIKQKECNKLKINLLIIKENDWNNNKNSCMDIIYNFIKGGIHTNVR